MYLPHCNYQLFQKTTQEQVYFIHYLGIPIQPRMHYSQSEGDYSGEVPIKPMHGPAMIRFQDTVRLQTIAGPGLEIKNPVVCEGVGAARARAQHKTARESVRVPTARQGNVCKSLLHGNRKFLSFLYRGYEIWFRAWTINMVLTMGRAEVYHCGNKRN